MAGRLLMQILMLRRPRILVFDEAVSNLDQHTAEHFAKTINTLKGKVTMIFITHQIPKGLQVDEVFSFGNDHQHNTKVGVVGETSRDADAGRKASADELRVE